MTASVGPYFGGSSGYLNSDTPPPYEGMYGVGSSNQSAMTVPSAPPVDKMDHIPGYEGTTYQQLPSAPPSYFEATSEPPRHRPPVNNAFLTEEEVRGALAQFVSEHCCYGKKPITEMNINGIEPAYAYHYTLETYTERRETSWAVEPFEGQPIDGPQNGPAPGPWQVNLTQRLPQFEGGVLAQEVPHTASVKMCHMCLGLGRRPCARCTGMGSTMCSSCNGSGRRFGTSGSPPDPCMFCNAAGRERCSSCSGSGQRTCDSCRGKCQLKCYIKLTATFTNHLDDHYVDRSVNSTLPAHLVKKSTGHLIFDECLPRVWPMSHFSDCPSVVEASRQLINKHATAFPAEFIHNQRQRIKVVPVTNVFATYKNQQASFYVYGLQNQVYFPDYFVKCCGCCSIL